MHVNCSSLFLGGGKTESWRAYGDDMWAPLGQKPPRRHLFRDLLGLVLQPNYGANASVSDKEPRRPTSTRTPRATALVGCHQIASPQGWSSSRNPELSGGCRGKQN